MNTFRFVPNSHPCICFGVDSQVSQFTLHCPNDLVVRPQRMRSPKQRPIQLLLWSHPLKARLRIPPPRILLLQQRRLQLPKALQWIRQQRELRCQQLRWQCRWRRLWLGASDSSWMRWDPRRLVPVLMVVPGKFQNYWFGEVPAQFCYNFLVLGCWQAISLKFRTA